MRRIEKITGRTDDMIILRGVNLFPTQIEELILSSTTELSPHFQCILDRSGHLDSMTVLVERREGVQLAVATAAGTDLVEKVKNLIGVTVAVDVVDPGTIERSVGKMRRVVDHRPKR